MSLPTLVAAALLICSVAAYAAGEPPAIPETDSVKKGEPLATALEQLRRQGLNLIFSSALIGTDLRVDVDPGSGTPKEVARRILAPHGLTLEPIRPGLFAVVRGRADSLASDAHAGEAQAAEPRTPAEPLYEVNVYASRYKIEPDESTAALAELTREDLQALPGLEQDVLRVTRFLPGTASNSLSARSHVRGGRNDELAVFFDGVPLFEPFHYKDVQGLLGILDPDSISTVDFFSGVFPARYGNRLSGVLDIAPRTWAGANYNAIGASVLYSHALAQGRLDTHPLEWLASVRRGNIDLFADLVRRQQTEPNFLDALGRLQLDVGPHTTLVGGWLMLDDALTVNFEDNSERGHIEYRDATGWLSWRFRPSRSAELRATLSRAERHTDREGSVDQPDNSRGTLDDRRVFDTTTFRLEASARPSRRLTLNSGLEWYDYEARYRYRSNAVFDPTLAAAFGRAPTYSQATALSAQGEAYAAYASTMIGIARDFRLDLSLRWDAQRFHTAFHDDQVSPRMSLQYEYDRATTVRVSWGRSAQTLRPDELQVQEGDTSFPAAQHLTQIAVSMERRFVPTAMLRVELYDKRVHDPAPDYENLLDPFALLPELEVDRVRIQPDRSRIYGAELSVRWQWPQKWSGWTSYSWSEATDHFGPVSVLRTWDQKHAMSTGLAWTSRPWQLSANLSWHTGWRRNGLLTTPSGVELEPRNADHWPAYFSLDVRAGWTRALRKGTLDAFFEIDNLTDRNNPCCARYELSSSGAAEELEEASHEESTWLPRLFLLGLTWQLP